MQVGWEESPTILKYKLKLDIPIWCSVLKALDGAWQICEKSARDMLIVLLAVPSINCIFAKHKFKFAYKTVIVVQHLSLSILQDGIFFNFNFLHHLHQDNPKAITPSIRVKVQPKTFDEKVAQKAQNHWLYELVCFGDWLFVFDKTISGYKWYFA